MIKKEIMTIANKAGFVLDDSKTVDWSSDYTKELNTFSELLVKDLLKEIKDSELKERIKSKYGVK